MTAGGRRLPPSIVAAWPEAAPFQSAPETAPRATPTATGEVG